MEAYKILILFTEFSQEHFLPSHIGNYGIIDLLFREKNQDLKRNIASLFIISSHLIKCFLKNLFYIGPIRDYPARIYEVNKAYSHYVGKSGSFFPSILITNKNYEEKVNSWFERLEMFYRARSNPRFDKVQGFIFVKPF